MVQQEQQPNLDPLWKVGVPRQTTIPDPSRGYVQGWEIPVIMADKTSFTVTVPADSFTPEHVREVIEDHVNRVVAIRTLEGPTY